MSMFLKQQSQYTQDDDSGKKIFWGRANDNMAPFRANSVPLLKDHEYEEAVHRVWDTKFGIFDASQPEQQIQGRTLREVMDNCMIGWWHPLIRKHRWKKLPNGDYTVLIYMEWAEPYDEPDPDYLNRVM